MLGRWSNYRMRMAGFRQKYQTIMRKKINTQRNKVMIDMRRRFIKSIGYTLLFGTLYYYGNQIYSEYHEEKQVKKKIFKDYPEKMIYIGIKESQQQIQELINETINQQPLTDSENKRQIKKNSHFVFLEASEKADELSKKLGANVIIFSPSDLDELCNAIELCHKYRHKVLCGVFHIQKKDQYTQNQVITILDKLPQPTAKGKEIFINLQNMKNLIIDEINDTIDIDTGYSCSQINDKLISSGYQPLFHEFYGAESIFQCIINNYPLKKNTNLNNQLINLTVVSASGVKFRSSTEVQSMGQIPNLTSLFVGTGGAFGIAASARLKIKRKSVQNHHYYKLKTSERNQKIMQLRQIRKYMQSNNIQYSLSLDLQEVHLTTEQPIHLENMLSEKSQAHKEEGNLVGVFSINNKITEKLIMGKFPFIFNVDKNVLKVYKRQKFSENEINKLISDISLEGGILVWLYDGSSKSTHQTKQTKLEEIKKRIDLTEVSAELMKKIVEVREGIDKRHILDSHERYEKYYKKGLFRKITEFFW